MVFVLSRIKQLTVDEEHVQLRFGVQKSPGIVRILVHTGAKLAAF